MKNANFLIKTIAIAGLLSQSLALGAGQPEIDSAIKGCQGNRGTPNGHMPWGATDQDLISYQGKNLCTNNKGRPIGENCEKTLKRLYDVASDLNKMVKEGCAKFAPMFVGNKDLQKCMDGMRVNQANCSQSNYELLKPVIAEIAKFRTKLKEFSGAMKEQQQYVAQSSENVVKVLEENQSARNTPSYNSGGYSASQMAVSSISESDKLNNFQDAGAAQALVQEIQKKFEKSERNYSNVTEQNYDQLRKPIEESFKKVGQLQSRVLREQLHGFLKAEELKLASKLYDNQLADTAQKTEKMITTGEKNTNNMNSLTSSAGGLPQMAGPGSGGSESGIGGTGYSPNSGVQGSALKDGNSLTSPRAADNKQPGTLIGDAGSKGGATGEDGSISTSAASRSPSSLKDSLRKKLAESAAGTTGASLATGGVQGAEGEKAKSEGVAAAGIRGADGYSLLDQSGGGAPDPLLEGFAAPLEKGGFNIGSGTDDSVKELLGELKSAFGEKDHLSSEIAASESPSLFLRVREFHSRCLKRGCVVGTGKGSI